MVDATLCPSAVLTAVSNCGRSRAMLRGVTGIGRCGNRETISRSYRLIPTAACEACEVLPATRVERATRSVKLAGNVK